MQTATEIISHYRAVRSRLWGGAAKQPPSNEMLLPMVRIKPKPQRVDFEIIQVRPKQRHRQGVLKQGDFKKVVRAACKRWGVSAADVLGAKRKRRLVLARIDIIRDLHHAGWAYARIGRRIGRDHSSVLSLHKKYTPDSDAYRRLVAAERKNPT